MANEFKIKKGLIVQGSGSTILDVQGSQGQLFSVTDQLSGSLFSVNDISGMPILEVFSDDSIKLGTFNAESIKISGSNATITGSLFGSSSYALTASYANLSGLGGFIQGGNSFGTTALLGTNDEQSLALETSGSTRMFISSSGNVGIGTNTPTATLQIININSSTDANTSNYPLKITNNAWAVNQISGLEFWNGSNKVVATSRIISQMQGNGAGGEQLIFQTQPSSITNPNPNQPTTKLVILSDGNVGIGTTAPTAKLHIAAPGTGSADIALRIRNSADTGDLLNVNGFGTVITGGGATAAYDALIVKNSIGTVALTVNNVATTIIGQDLAMGNSNGVLYWNNNQIRNIASGVLRVTNGSNSDFTRLQFGGGTTSYPSLQRSGSALCVVDATGTFSTNLLVGTTTDNGAKLQVSGSAIISGSLTVTSNITIPNRPAFRVTGVGSTDITAITVLSSSAVTVDYNQGSYYNNTDGTFTAPVAGLYSVYMNVRCGSVNSMQQVILLKNTTTSSLMWESGTNTGATHFGVSGILNLAVNDTLKVQVQVGTVQFDANNSWGAAYIG